MISRISRNPAVAERWVLVLASVASLMVALDASGRVHRAEHDPPAARGLDQRARVDGQCLQPQLRGAAHHRLGTRGPVRAPAPVRRGPGPVRRFLGSLRTGPQYRAADRRPGGPGRGRRLRRARCRSPCSLRPHRPTGGARRWGSTAPSPGLPCSAALFSAERSPRAWPGSGCSGSTCRSGWSPFPSSSPASRRATDREPGLTPSV